ncbi:GNAT family N-acetyltransferase [Oscillochloris sp. ZM17-4]|uniref:GNAT family N-acetyltransferase n=1 Tax=Oscillochloris sp. ZM17-4 TaxID=2866714 RepID=UPI001C72EB6D|nr:GNAT family N-acetyltransferase [Oscillochloris sp. ZM17-4]MBX0326459.1 GNAT family N-acetyltransferase [Oscillochloris sp. ZM17-4]
MPIEIVDLDERWQPEALSYLRRSPYRNAIPLSNVTQLRSRCDVVVAHSNGFVQGVASHYRDLPFLGLVFVAEIGGALPALLTALRDRVPVLGESRLTTVLPEQRVRQLAACADIESVDLEMQMVVEPETLRPRTADDVRRLRPEDLPAMGELAALGELMAWGPEAMELGPAFGAFVDGQLAAMASIRFATPDVIEIGNIVTHPGYRRRGLASACTSALAQACFGLAPRVYLMVMLDNQSAFDIYRALGFWPAERFGFVQFRLR